MPKEKAIFIKPVSEKKLVNAGTTLGIDEMFLAMNMNNGHHPKKLNLIKAAVGTKDIKFKKPLVQWEQQYQKLNL